jgi:cytochrome c
MKRIWLMVASLGAGVLIGGNQMPAAEPVAIDLTQWKPPDFGTVGDDPFGKLVKYGHALFTDTANEIGPAVSDAAKRFAGNNLACQNCHLQAGTQPYAMPMTAFGANSHNTVGGRARLTRSKSGSTAAWSGV